MALLFCDSFDHWTTAAEGGMKYVSVAGLSFSPTGGRRGTRGLIMGGSGSLNNALSAQATYIVGLSVQPTALPVGVGLNLFQFREGTTVHVSITIDNLGA